MKQKPNGKPAVRIESFDQLQALCEQPVLCAFELDGQTIELPCKRLSPRVQEEVLAITRLAQPPLLKGSQNGDVNYHDPKYQAERERNLKMARAFIVYTGCPAIAQKNPGLTDRNAIYEFVQGLLSETILEIIALTIQKGGVDYRERADFTSTPASES